MYYCIDELVNGCPDVRVGFFDNHTLSQVVADAKCLKDSPVNTIGVARNC